MIRNSIYKTVLPLATVLDENNQQLTVAANTVLGDLVGVCPIMDSSSDISSFDVETYGSQLEMMTSSYDGKPTKHDLTSNGYVDDIGKFVLSHVAFAKSVVKPLVLEYSEILGKYLSEATIKEPSQDFKIQVMDIPSILTDESFLDIFTYYKNKKALRPELDLKLSQRPLEEIYPLLTVGHEKTDEKIKEWLSGLDVYFISNIWTSFFSDKGDINTPYISYYDIESDNPYDQVNYALALYLIANKLYSNLDESAKDIPLAVYNSACLQIRDFAGSLLVGCLNRLDLYTRTNMLVVTMNSSLKIIKVNGSIYRSWLKEGGSVEVLLGLLITDKNINSVTLINNSAQDLINSWNSYVNFSRMKESNNRINYYKDFVKASFYSFLTSTMSEDEKAYSEKNKDDYYVKIKELLEKELNEITNTTIDNYQDTAIDCICKVRFFYTGAFYILNDINEAGKVNPNINVREAALIATINYLTDYITDQITVSV